MPRSYDVTDGGHIDCEHEWRLTDMQESATERALQGIGFVRAVSTRRRERCRLCGADRASGGTVILPADRKYFAKGRWADANLKAAAAAKLKGGGSGGSSSPSPGEIA